MNSNLTGEGVDAVKKKSLPFSPINRLLSIDMKTKVVQHVKSESFLSFFFQVFRNIPGSQLLSDVQTFFLFTVRGDPFPPSPSSPVSYLKNV